MQYLLNLILSIKDCLYKSVGCFLRSFKKGTRNEVLVFNFLLFLDLYEKTKVFSIRNAGFGI